MKIRINLAYAMTVAVAASTLAACGSGDSDVAADCEPAHNFSTVDEGKLTVSTFEIPPYVETKGETLGGSDGDILTEIAKMECLTVEVKTAAVAAIVPSVQSGRADVAAGNFYRTVDRAEVVAMSDPLYLDQMGLVSESGIASIEELEGKTVGAISGYLWVDDLKAFLGDDLKLYSSALNMYQDIREGRIDVATDSYPAAAHAAKGFEVKIAEPFDQVAASVEPGQSGFPLPPDNEEMIKAFNADIAELHKSGKIAEILKANGLEASAADVGEPRLIG